MLNTQPYTPVMLGILVLWQILLVLYLFKGQPGPSDSTHVFLKSIVAGAVLRLGFLLAHWALLPRLYLGAEQLNGQVYLALMIDTGTLITLSFLLTASGVTPRAHLLYSLNPMSIFAVSLGWPVLLPVFLLVVVMWSFTRRRPLPWLGFLLLGTLLLLEPLCVFLLLLFLTRKTILHAPLAAVHPLLFRFQPSPLPLPQHMLLGNVSSFSSELNGKLSSWSLWRFVGLEEISQEMLVVVGIGIVGLVIAARVLKSDSVPAMVTIVWSAIVLVNPALGPQHLLYGALFLCLRPNVVLAFLPVIVLVPIGLASVAGATRIIPEAAPFIFVNSRWVFWIVWPAIAALGLLLLVRQRQWSLQPRCLLTAVDIVIPTMNEGSNIADMLTNLRAAVDAHAQTGSKVKVRTIIVDGGSSDNTREIAEEMGAEVIVVTEAGRGNQLAEGIEAGHGDLVLMLHADARMAEHALVRLVQLYRKSPQVEWGIMGHIYERRPLKMRIIELSNRLRFHVLGIAFGDQGIFVRRDVLGRVRMPEIRLMEDVELSLRLAGSQSRASLGKQLVVSTRRWDKRKFSGYTFMVLRLTSTFLLLRALGMRIDRITDKMYRWYYKKA